MRCVLFVGCCVVRCVLYGVAFCLLLLGVACCVSLFAVCCLLVCCMVVSRLLIVADGSLIVVG